VTLERAASLLQVRREAGPAPKRTTRGARKAPAKKAGGKKKAVGKSRTD
jgi:topoisomerase IA-like protein